MEERKDSERPISGEEKKMEVILLGKRTMKEMEEAQLRALKNEKDIWKFLNKKEKRESRRKIAVKKCVD